MSIRTYIYAALMCLCLLMAGCRRTPYYHLDTLPQVTLRIDFDWNGYTDIPPGMNLMFYPIADEPDEAASLEPIFVQLQYDGGEVSLPVGNYNVAVYNDYTYNLNYRGMESFHTAEAYVGENNRQPLASRYSATRNVACPDIFYVTQICDLSVEQTDEDRVILVKPELKTLTLHFHVRGKGVEYIKGVEGGLSGIAGSIMLATGQSAETTPSGILFPMEIRTTEMYATASTFLLDERLSPRYDFKLAFLLNNNSVSMSEKHNFDVTDQITAPLKANGNRIPPEGIHVYINDIVIDPVSSSGGFDAVIDGWGNSEDIELR